MTGGKGGRLALLDGLRGVAALAVLLHHEALAYGSPGLLPRAYLAVDFFFMLSGLVLTLAYEPRLRAGLSTGDFLRARVRRLWPVLAVGIAIGGARALWRDDPAASSMLMTSLLMVPMLTGETGWGIYRLDGPQWSVAFELVANALHGALLARLETRAVAALALVAGTVLAWCIGHFGKVGIGDTVDNWWAGLPRVVFSYALGVGMGRRMQAGQGPAPVTRHWWLAALPVPIVLVGAGWLPLGVAQGDALAVFVALPLALWLAAGVMLPVWAARIAAGMGALSYPLYAVHGPLLALGHDAVAAWGRWPMPLRAANLAVILVAAWGLMLATRKVGQPRRAVAA